MQPWSGGRRRERSSSVVILGKLSAIVRRGSVFQADPEDVHGISSSEDDKELEDDEAVAEVAVPAETRHKRRSSMSATVMTLWDPSNSANNSRRTSQRFQFYPARPLVVAALARPLTQQEVARRVTVETQIDNFGAMHERFAPSTVLKLEKEKEKKELDNNELETLEEEQRAAFSGAEDEDETTGASFEEMLDFEHVNLRRSVRRLMSRIESESESFMRESDVTVVCSTDALFNEETDEENELDDDIDQVDDVDDLDLENNDPEQDEERFCSVAQKKSKQEFDLTQELSPAEHRMLQRRHARLLSCTAENAASTQDQLTSSMRRLVIQLKDDSDQLTEPLAQSHGTRHKPKSAPMRRRAGSCPNRYDLVPCDSLSPDNGSPMPSPPDASGSPVYSQHEAQSGKKHKKSAFSRIAPRVLKTLHLRKKRKTYLFTDEELETIDGARWKIVELAFRFGGKHRSYLVQAVNMFFPLLKYGRRGGAHATRLHCNCCGTLQWQHKRGGLSRAVDLAEVLQVLDGRETSVFRKYGTNNVLEACSFSVVFLDRTLDLETQSSSHRDWLVSALRTLVAYARRQRRIEQQAIAERTILPLEDDVLPSLSPSTIPVQTSSLDDNTMMAATPPNYRLRTVY